jgi:hypothetical protein
MDKKELKFYVTPSQEIIETELQGFLCASPGSNPGDVPDEEVG